MIAKLSDELVRELDRNGSRPLSVEDPRSHKLYVIVSADDYRPVSQSSSVTPAKSDWTEKKNARRFALIDKEFAGTLTPAEAEELGTLQREADEYLDRVAPQPLEAARALHERLLRQSQERVRD